MDLVNKLKIMLKVIWLITGALIGFAIIIVVVFLIFFFFYGFFQAFASVVIK